MPKTVALDQQYFNDIRERGYFYVDKTAFIRDWWRAGDTVTLITRPRRFGKSLMMSTVDCFFSMRHAGRSDLFEGLEVWKDEQLKTIQGSFPLVFLSFASVKGKDFETQRREISRIIANQYSVYEKELTGLLQNGNERKRWAAVSDDMTDDMLSSSLNFLSCLLHRAYGRKVIILLDEYDTPMQEAWVKGFWNEHLELMRGLLNSTFKTNPYLERAILTGVTRVSKESLFSDFNNIRVISTTSTKYETAFGFTEKEVVEALNEYGFTDFEGVKAMYDGFTFGSQTDVYNPWSIISYLQEGRLEPWWINTSSNGLVGKLVREGDANLKQDFMTLLEGGVISSAIDEQIVFDQLEDSDEAIWSLLLASGYLKVDSVDPKSGKYSLRLTNGEVRRSMVGLVAGWFGKVRSAYGNFIKALLQGDLDYMNEFMNDVAGSCFSSFDTGGPAGKSEPERFYHGFVLGLLVDLRDRYVVTSNRESGFGRYDVLFEPRDPSKDFAFIIEFKVNRSKQEPDLEATVMAALSQIEEKHYAKVLEERGIPAERIRKYGFAFRGKEVLIGQG